MNDNQTHIAIEFPDHYPYSFESELESGLESEYLILRTFRREPQIMAAAEWVFPGVIAVYILKPYFESFLKEAGKDNYIYLKRKLHDLLKKAKSKKVVKMTSAGAQEYDIKKNPQSLAISVYFQTKNGPIIRLFYDNRLELDNWLEANDKFMDLIFDHYNEKSSTNPLTSFLKEDGSDTKGLYAIIDPKTNQWIISNNPSTFKEK